MKGRPTHKGVALLRMRTTDLKGQCSNKDTRLQRTYATKFVVSKLTFCFILFYCVCTCVHAGTHLCVNIYGTCVHVHVKVRKTSGVITQHYPAYGFLFCLFIYLLYFHICAL